MEPKTTITVRSVDSTSAILDIQGEINAFAENELMDAYNKACSKNPRRIVLNFSQMSYMNSSGIGLLVTLLIRAQRQQQRLSAFGLSEHYRQIFELTRLNEAISIHETEKDALAA
jgi:anti-sigma B factor antagonist